MRGPDKEERELLEQYGFEAAVCRYCSRGWESTKTSRCKGCGAKIPKPYGLFWEFPVWIKDAEKAGAFILNACYGISR